MKPQILKKTLVLFSAAAVLTGYNLTAAPGTAGAGAGVRTGGTVAPNSPTPTSPNLTPPSNPNLTSPNSPNLTPPGNPNLTSPNSPNLTPPGNPNLTSPNSPNLTTPANPNLTLPGNPNAIPTNAVPNTGNAEGNGNVSPNGVIQNTTNNNGINQVFPDDRRVRHDRGTNRVPQPGLRGNGTNGFYRNPGTNQVPPGAAVGVNGGVTVTPANP